MKLTTSTNLQQTQKQTLSPQLQHAVKLLQMPSLELISKIQEELAENPFLEEKYEDLSGEEKTDNRNKEVEDYSPLDIDIKDNKINENSNNESVEHIFEDSSDFSYTKKSNYNDNPNSKQSFLENAIAVNVSLYDHLTSQLELSNASEEQFTIAMAIISSLDAEGYFRVPIKEFAESMDTTEDEVLETLDIVQEFDPPGIAAKDLQDCLMIQLRGMQDPDPILVELIRDYFKLVEKKKLKELATKLDLSMDQLKIYLKELSNFEPIPARQFDTKTVKYVVPDIIIQRVEGGFSIALNDGFLPSLKINNFYKKVLKTEELKSDAKSYLDNKYNEARLLIFSLERRRSTIYRVMEKILEMQKNFFISGPQYLKPLTLKDVADEVEMHESTISRVTTGKYVDTPWGIFELKYFFSNSIKKAGGGVKSAQSVKELIKEIIENESGEKRLSDQKIVEILSNKGIKIARRTVAKYRKNLKIFSSYDR